MTSFKSKIYSNNFSKFLSMKFVRACVSAHEVLLTSWPHY